MKRTLSMLLVLALTAGCGQSDPTTTTSPAASEPEAVARTVETQSAESSRRAEQPVTDAAAAPEREAGRIELAQADLSAVEAAGFIEGQHYRVLSAAAQPATSGRVEVNEFFMHSCVHCYNLEPYVEAWLETKPDYIDFVRIPTTWDAYRTLHAQAYYAAEALGIVDEVMMPWFQEIHVAPENYLDSFDKLAELFARYGVEPDEFEAVFESFAVRTKINRATELTERYRVDSTPTLVIAGKYTTGTGMADPVRGDPAKLFELIEVLAAAELGR